MEPLSAHAISAIVGLAGGFTLGLAARLGRFCTLAAIEDAMFGRNTMRWRMWVLAIGVSVLLTHIAVGLGMVDLSKSLYATRPFNAASIVVGGVLFGLGMALVGTCGFGTLVRLGGGDLRSFLVFLVIAVSAYMAAAGPTARLRQVFLDPFDVVGGPLVDPRLDVVLEATTGLPGYVAVLGVAMACFMFSLGDRRFRDSTRATGWSVLIAIAIVSGWVGTSFLAHDPFDPVPVQSFSFIQPLGATVMFLMTSTGSEVGFGTGATVGVILGALAGASWKSEFRWEASDDAREAKRQILGAFLMGTGGMYALGCTIGQGLTGASALALSAPLALASIWLGAWVGLSYLMEGSLRGLMTNPFRR